MISSVLSELKLSMTTTSSAQVSFWRTRSMLASSLYVRMRGVIGIGRAAASDSSCSCMKPPSFLTARDVREQNRARHVAAISHPLIDRFHFGRYATPREFFHYVSPSPITELTAARVVE